MPAYNKKVRLGKYTGHIAYMFRFAFGTIAIVKSYYLRREAAQAFVIVERGTGRRQGSSRFVVVPLPLTGTGTAKNPGDAFLAAIGDRHPVATLGYKASTYRLIFDGRKYGMLVVMWDRQGKQPTVYFPETPDEIRVLAIHGTGEPLHFLGISTARSPEEALAMFLRLAEPLLKPAERRQML